MPADQSSDQSLGYSRRSFLTRFSLGLAAIAGAGLLFRTFLMSGGREGGDPADQLPPEGSIFHPDHKTLEWLRKGQP